MNLKTHAFPLLLAVALAAPLRAEEPKSAAPAPSTPSTAASAAPASPRKIAMTAKKFEFNPSTVEIAVGETVELTITSLDRKHGFACKELGIRDQEILPEKPLVVTIRAEKPGEYEFRCSSFCGLGHGRMKGKFVAK